MTRMQVEETAVSRLHTGNEDDPRGARLIINADDWGRDQNVTDRILDCVLQGVVSSTSAMVFMEDSERSAELSQQHDVDAGLHLNLTTPFSAPNCPERVSKQQQKLTRFLRLNSLAPAIYHPGLSGAFEYVVKAQLEEYERLYGKPAARIDGHHHMHLCSNVQFQNLLPAGTVSRRNFSFGPGEKNALNRFYRRSQDRRIAKKHPTTDFFFSLPPMNPPSRLERIFDLACRFVVELETHPVDRSEYEFLTGGELIRRKGNAEIARGYRLA